MLQRKSACAFPPASMTRNGTMNIAATRRMYRWIRTTCPKGIRSMMKLVTGLSSGKATASPIREQTPPFRLLARRQRAANTAVTRAATMRVMSARVKHAAAATLPSGVVIQKDCPNSHSAVPVPGRRLALTTDEVYGTFTLLAFGCRWGWMRLVDVADPAHPFITGEFLLDQDQPAFCGTTADSVVSEQWRSFSSHNPTVLRNLALVTWHSGGLQAIDIANSSHPRPAGVFMPTPIPVVATEDPGVSQGPATTVDQLNNPDV